MTARMLCLDCETTAFSDTVIEGSDWLEGVGWLAGGAPGWLYCAWRHAGRSKRCPECGGAHLLRETRAAARRDPAAPPSQGVRIIPASGPTLWPGALRDPRERLRRGVFWLAAWALGVAGQPLEGALLAMALLAGELTVDARLPGAPVPCRAWDARGRPLRVEVVSSAPA